MHFNVLLVLPCSVKNEVSIKRVKASFTFVLIGSHFLKKWLVKRYLVDALAFGRVQEKYWKELSKPLQFWCRL